MNKILLVEDNPANRLLISRMLSTLGYFVICAGDGLRGLNAMEDNPDIGLVLSDCQMPNLDGPGLVNELRRRKGYEFPIILYSSFLSVKELASLLEKGATSVLSYPLSIEQLREYCVRHLGN